MQIFQNYFQVANLSNHIVNNKILGVLILKWYSWGRETKMGGKHRENVGLLGISSWMNISKNYVR